jgi:hypothetical protein
MKNGRQLFAFAAFVVFLAAVLFVARKSVIRLFVAVSIAHLRIFTPPQIVAGESRSHRIWNECRFYWDFADIREAREKRLQRFEPELKPLVEEIKRRQKAGEGLQYSMHIYREVRWRLNFTPDMAATERRIADLRESLNQPEAQKLAPSSRKPMEAGGWESKRGISSSTTRSRMVSTARILT